MSFPTTNWKKLAAATLNGGEEGREALGWICEKYYVPVELAIRSRGIDEERVEDMRQDFFLTLMEGGFFRRAQQDQGKFRTFLHCALRDFLVDDKRRLMASKRGGELQRVEMSESVGSWEIDELQFDLAWAETLFSSATEAVGKDVEAKRGREGWKMLQSFLTGATQRMSYEELGEALNSTEGAVKTEISRMRAKFREQLRGELWQTVSAPHEIDEEFTYLSKVMSRVWGGASA